MAPGTPSSIPFPTARTRGSSSRRPRNGAGWPRRPFRRDPFPRHFPEPGSLSLHLRPARRIGHGWEGDCQSLSGSDYLTDNIQSSLVYLYRTQIEGIKNVNMKQRLTLAISGIIFLVYLGGCCRPDPDASFVNTVDTLRAQETVNWCWAAVTQMLAQHLGLSITQCALANHSFDKTNCCQSQSQAPCLKEQQKVMELLEKIHALEPIDGMSPKK